MRFFIAAALFVASVVTLLVGVAQRTIWAPPPSVSMSIEVESTSNFITIPNQVLTSHPGTPTIEVAGTKKTFLASAREADIRAWVGLADHQDIGLNEEGVQLTAINKLGAKQKVSPFESDLWREEVRSGSKGVIKVNPEAEAAVLVASDGFRKAPTSLTITWPIAYDLTPSNTFLITGLVLLLGAILFNYLAFSDRKRKRGPRRRFYQAPKPPQYKFKVASSSVRAKGRRSSRNNALAVPSSILILALLSGCTSDTSLPVASPSSSADSEAAVEVAPPVVTEMQLSKILKKIELVVKSADAEKSASVLKDRFTGPALQLRSAHYKLMSRSRKIAALPSIVGSPITFNLPAASDVWPRTVMAVTDEKGDTALPQLLVLQQKSPRSNYEVWYYVRLMPGAAIPAVPTADVGSIPVDKSSLFLALKPTKIATAYGDVVNNGARSLSAALFDLTKDEFYKQVSQSQKDQVANLTTGKITFTHRLGDPNIISLSTSGAGALVAVYMNDIYQIKPRTPGSAVAVSGQEKLLLGADGSVRGVRSLYGDMLLFYVPALSEKARIRLLGATQGLVSVRSL